MMRSFTFGYQRTYLKGSHRFPTLVPRPIRALKTFTLRPLVPSYFLSTHYSHGKKPFSTIARSQEKETKVVMEGGKKNLILELAENQKYMFGFSSKTTLKEIINDIREEDATVNTVAFYRKSGERLSISMRVKELLHDDFVIDINGKKITVQAPQPGDEDTGNVLGQVEMNRLVQKAFFRKIQSLLQKANRNHIPYNLYVRWCEDFGLNKKETEELILGLHQIGVVLHFKDNPELKDFVFLKPSQVYRSLIDHLDLTYIKRDYEALHKELLELRNKIKNLDEQKVSFDRSAARYANNVIYFGFALVTTQFLILARMVWWDFSWDIMEPISYFVSLATVMVGYTFFVFRGQDYTYPDLKDLLTKKRLRKLYLDNGFNWPKWNQLNLRIKEIEEELGINTNTAEHQSLLHANEHDHAVQTP